MKIVTGSKLSEVSQEKFNLLKKDFERVVIDLGTGDGRYIFESAKKNKETLFIGIDPASKQLEIYSRKANRKKLKNTLFVIGSVEFLPKELKNCADEVKILLPWGTLLEKVVKPTRDTVSSLAGLLKKNGELTIIFGYTQDLEPSETQRLDLPEINEQYIQHKILPGFLAEFKISRTSFVKKEDLKQVPTTWSKRLRFGGDREIFTISLEKLH